MRPYGNSSTWRTSASYLHIQGSPDEFFWSYRSDCLKNVSGKRDSYSKLKVKKKIKVEKKTLIGKEAEGQSSKFLCLPYLTRGVVAYIFVCESAFNCFIALLSATRYTH